MQKLFSTVPPYKLTKQLTLEGVSIGAYKTAFRIPELGIMLDCGERIQSQITHIFITHLHTDHCHDAPIMIQEASQIESGTINFIMHGCSVEPFKRFVNATMNMIDSEGGEEGEEGENTYKITSVYPSSTITIVIKKREWDVEIIKCLHTPDCIGFGFTENRKKIKKEYESLKGSEIVELKKQNIEIMDNVKFPTFVFLGDTHINIFERSPTIFNYPIIIVECNFIYDEDKPTANRKKHICWLDLKPIINNHKNNTFILIHFSRKHTFLELQEFFNKEKQEGITNIVPWIPPCTPSILHNNATNGSTS